MKIAVLTFDGFNELDSFIASAMLNRVKQPHLEALIVGPSERMTSMNGVVVHAQAPLGFAREADAVIVGSGTATRDVVRNAAIMAELKFDPSRQIIAAQCSGALVLARLGLLANVPACTDTRTKPWVEEAGVSVLEQPFVAHGNVATAGGCLASHYLAAWVIARLAGREAAQSVLRYVAPVGQKEDYVDRAFAVIGDYLPREEPMPQEIVIRGECPPELAAFLDEGLYEFNSRTTGLFDGRLFSGEIRDATGALVAAISGHTWGGSCEVKRLWVQESNRNRGLGKDLMRAAEAHALRLGCTQVCLATHSFQAPAFYERLGYRRVGAFDGNPRSHAKIFYMKRLEGQAQRQKESQ